MFCPDCGFEAVEGSRFCKRCGHRLTQSGNALQEELLSAIDAPNPEGASAAVGVEHRIEELLQDAMRSQSEGAYQEALVICEAILEVDKSNTSAHSMMAIIYEKLEKTALAVEHLKVVTQLNPGSVADRIRLEELQQQLGFGRVNNGISLPSAPVIERKPISPIWIAIGSAAVVFVLGAITLNMNMNRHSAARPASTTNMTDTGAPALPNSVGLPQNTQPTDQTALPANSNSIQPYVAGGAQQQASQTPQVNPLLQQPERTPSYQPRSSNSGSGLSALPALPPITATPRSETETREPERVKETPVEAAVKQPEPRDTAPKGIYEITVSSGAPSRPKPTQSGGTEVDTLLRIASEKASSGDYRGALDSYKAAQSYGANSASVSNNIAQAHRRLNNVQDARRAYQDALKKANDAISRGVNVAQATRDRENAEQGLRACGD